MADRLRHIGRPTANNRGPFVPRKPRAVGLLAGGLVAASLSAHGALVAAPPPADAPAAAPARVLDARVEATFAPHTPPPVRQFLQGAPALPNKPQLEAWSRSVLRNQQERLPVPTFVRLEAESGGKLTVFGAGGVPHSFDKV
ncbi:MAG: hypothetical protein ACRC1K_09575, partial [Planctomycetia bacterium]